MSDQGSEMRFDLIMGSLSMTNLTHDELHKVSTGYLGMSFEDAQKFCKRCSRLGKSSAKKGSIKAYRRQDL